MTSTQPYLKTRSSNALIKGDSLRFLEAGLDFTEDIDDLYYLAIQRTLDILQEEMREEAEKLPEWKDYADLIYADYVEGEIVFVLDGEPERVEEAMKLEFGHLEERPQSVIRKTHSKTEEEQKHIVNNLLKEEMPLAYSRFPFR